MKLYTWERWTLGLILIPVAALIVYRICRRHNRSTKLAVFLIIAAGALSLSAQLAVAKASLSGWVVSAAPMAAFMLLTKLVLSLLAPERGHHVVAAGRSSPRMIRGTA